MRGGRVADRFITRPTRANPPRQGPHQGVRPARGLENGLVRPCGQRVISASDAIYFRSAVDPRFVAPVGWWATFRTETAYWPRLLSGSTFGTTTVRWKASQFSRDS